MVDLYVDDERELWLANKISIVFRTTGETFIFICGQLYDDATILLDGASRKGVRDTGKETRARNWEIASF